MKEKLIGNRMWKSGKIWLYCAGTLAVTLTITSSEQLVHPFREGGPRIVQADTASSDQIIYGAPNKIDEQKENENLAPTPSEASTKPQARLARSTEATNSVTRTSDGFTALNPTPEVKSLKVAWVKDTSEIGISVGNAFYINTPYTMDVELNKPLAKGESVQVKVEVVGEIFNSTSKSKDWHTNPYTGQNNGNYFESPDHSFSYDYSEKTGLLTITALTDANLTNFTGLTYFLSSKGSSWVPVPLNRNPYSLEGGTVGNYGQIGSGGTLSITVGNQSTSESITNLVDTYFTEMLVKTTTDTILKGSVNINKNARATDNFIAPLTNIIEQTNGGTTKLLDGSMDHYVITPSKNIEMADSVKKDPYAGIRIEAYIPVGSNSKTNVNTSVIFAGSMVSDFPAFKNVFKNAKVNADTGALEFDLSKDPKDWSNLAKALLAVPESSMYYDRVHLPYAEKFLESIAADDDKVGDTLNLHLYPVSPKVYEPINYNNAVSLNVKVTNNKSNKSVTDTLNVQPVSAGDAEATKATIMSQFVDEKTGKPIGEGLSSLYKSIDETWEVKPATIDGYAYVSTNDPDVTSKIGLSETLPSSGKVTADMIGKQGSIVFVYTNEGTITSHFVDKDGKSLKEDEVTTGVNGNIPELKAADIKNYVLTSTSDIPSFIAGKNQNVTYVYDNKAPITYTVIDETTHKTLEDKQSFATGTIGTEVANETTKNLLEKITKAYQDKGYLIGEISNKELPAPSNLMGYDIEIHLTHDTKQTVVDGENAKNEIVAPEVKRTVKYVGAGAKTPSSQVQKAQFDSHVTQTIDNVTGEVVSESEPTWFKVGSNIDEAQFDQITPPEIEGYTATISLVPGLKVNHSSQNTEVTVNYVPNEAQVKIVYQDVDSNASIPNDILAQEVLKGRVDEQFDNSDSFQEHLKQLERKGYELVSTDDLKGKYTASSQTRYVNLKHRVSTTPDYQVKDLTQTIHYVTEGGQTVAEDNIQVLHFTNGAAIDQVTKAVINDNWSEAQSTEKIKSPLVSGYTPDKDQVDSQTYNHTSDEQSINVTYKPNKQKLHIRFVDVEGLPEEEYSKGKVLSEYDKNLSGHSDENYDTKKDIQKTLEQLQKHGYECVLLDPQVTEGYYDHNDDLDQSYHVYLKHAKKTILGGYPKKDGQADARYNHVVKVIVHYQGAGKLTPKDHIEQVNFKAQVTYDLVTKEVLKTKWNGPKTTKAVPTPKLKGYQSDASVIKEETLSHISKDQKVTVRYTPQVQAQTKQTPKIEKPKAKKQIVLPKTGEETNKKLKLIGYGLLMATSFLLGRQSVKLIKQKRDTFK
jgi:LPXTG-motif cell wall-anchored protein